MANRVLGGRYAVQDKIGTGGMAIVYRGLDEVLGRTVAIKTMLPQYANDQSFAARFKQEAQAAAALQSPYIVSVYDWGKDEDAYYIIMEYLRGTDLKSGIRKHGALDCRKVAQIGSQISQALSVAHHHDIIHRDIKPQNIMVQPDGNIKVMDFGIARAKNSHLTTDNSVLGTAHYVSPEQTQGRELGPTTDIYSLGIVMYEASTGRVPFDGDDAISVALKQVSEPPMPPSQINPRVDPALESIILKCMQKNPNDRFQSADELYHVLRDYLSGRIQSVRDATSMASEIPTSRLKRNDNPMPAWENRQQAMRDRSTMSTTGHYRMKSATEEDMERKHRRNVIIGVIVSLIAIAGIAFAVFYFTGRPQTRSVPNLIGLTQEDAVDRIDRSDYFKIGTVKEEYSSKVDPGKVIDQDPDSNNSMPEGTQINLVISKGEKPAASVTVPDLSKKTPSEADNELKALNLVGKAGDGVYSDSVEVGRIVSQTPAAGATVKAGDTITYEISKGQEMVTVPDVIGYGQSDAKAMLESAGLKVMVNTEENESYTSGIVFRQSATGQVAKGSEVYITVSSGSNKVSIPNVVGKTESDAINELYASGFLVTVVDQPSDSVTSGYVITQSDTGSAAHGSTITVYVSTGSETSDEPTSDDSSSHDSSNGGSSSSSSHSSSSDSSSENKTDSGDTSTI